MFHFKGLVFNVYLFVRNRKVSVTGPDIEKVFVKRALRITGLPG
jgi:hypothetical protein